MEWDMVKLHVFNGFTGDVLFTAFYKTREQAEARIDSLKANDPRTLAFTVTDQPVIIANLYRHSQTL